MMKQVILCKNSVKDIILNKLFAQSSDKYLANIEVKDINLFIDSFFPNKESVYSLKKLLTTLPLNLFKESLDDYGFLQEIQKDSDELAKYQIDIDSLNIDEELKIILKCANNRDYSNFFKQLDALDASNYQIAEMPYDLFEEKVINILIKNGASYLSFIEEKENKEYLYNATVASDQFELACQYIIKNNLELSECAFIFCQNDYLMAQNCLDRYGIPYYGIGAYSSPALDLATLLLFIKNPNYDNYLLILKRNIFPYSSQLKEALKYIRKEDFLANLPDSKDRYLAELFTKNSATQEEISAILKKILTEPDFKKQIALCFDCLNGDEDEKEELYHFLIEKGKDMESGYLSFLIEELKTHKINIFNDGLLLLPYKREIYNRNYLFIFDCASSSFPAFKGLSGLLNEEILADTNYPSLALRQANFKKRMKYLNNAKTTIYFNSLATYEGKESPLSYAIEEKKLTLLNFELLKNEEDYNPEHKLNITNAKKAFFDKNDMIHGSVSSFEKYFTCPYAYFLRYGLKLKEKNSIALDAILIGNIIHNFTEKALRLYNKNYTDLTKAEIKEIVQAALKQIQEYFPNNSKDLIELENNIINSLQEHLAFLKTNEADNDYKPTYFETAFQRDVIKDEYKIALKGIIDRIDIYNNSYQIIDYKTSMHALKEEEVACGISLQLPTYLLYADSNKKPNAAFYYSLISPKKVKHTDYIYSATNGLKETEKEDDLKAYQKNFIINGWILENIPLASGYKTELIDNKTLNNALDIIYKHIYSALKNGKIAREPVETACTYCSYQELCHFKARDGYREAKPLYDFNIKKGSDDET